MPYAVNSQQKSESYTNHEWVRPVTIHDSTSTFAYWSRGFCLLSYILAAMGSPLCQPWSRPEKDCLLSSATHNDTILGIQIMRTCQTDHTFSNAEQWIKTTQTIKVIWYSVNRISVVVSSSERYLYRIPLHIPWRTQLSRNNWTFYKILSRS